MILDTKRGAVAAVARPANPHGAFTALATDTFTGRDVTPENALALSAVYGCVSLVSNACGAMPLEVIDTRNAAKPIVEGWSGAKLLRFAPNPDTSGVSFWTTVFAHLLLRGNAYLLKEKRGGRVAALWPVRPDRVSVYRDKDGVKTFRIRVYEEAGWAEVDMTASDVIHIMGPSFDDGLMGASPIAVMRNRIGVQLSQSEFQGRFYSQGMSMQGAIETAERMNEEGVQRVKRAWRAEFAGTGNAYGVAVLHSGSTFKPVQISPKDAEFIAAMRWGANEIATAYNVPASRLNAEGASLTYANQGQDDLFLYKQAFAPRLAMVEAALNIDTDLFGYASSWVPRFNADSQLRADIETRYRVYAQGRGMGVLSANEIRQVENMPPIDGGDDYEPVKASSPAPTETKSVTGKLPDVKPREVQLPSIRLDMPDMPVPVVNVTVPETQVTVNVPEQAPPNVNVNVPEGPAPVVMVDVPEQPAPVVNVDAPDVTVQMPNADRVVKFERDKAGRIIGASMEDN